MYVSTAPPTATNISIAIPVIMMMFT
jgi:hypothetical protein